MKTSLILACAGKGERVGADQNKLLIQVGGSTILDKTLSAFLSTGLIDEYIIVCSKQDFNYVNSLYGNDYKVVLGGATRTQSVKNALSFVSGDIVLIHDGARPKVSEQTIKNCIDGAIKNGSAIAVCPSRDTLCKVNDGVIENYLGKANIYNVQTPQAFSTIKIKQAYENIGFESYNDDGEVYAKTFGKVYIADGNMDNIKITYPQDLVTISPSPDGQFRFGTGFDCHELVENRKLILGGIEIEHTKGLLGHSDADVLTHAIMDALLSAAGLKDIGALFPDTDNKYKDINSMLLLNSVIEKITEKGFSVVSVTAVIMAQKPKLLPHIPNIVLSLANAIKIDKENVGISATTLEGLGFVGREEGICVSANAVLRKI